MSEYTLLRGSQIIFNSKKVTELLLPPTIIIILHKHAIRFAATLMCSSTRSAARRHRTDLEKDETRRLCSGILGTRDGWMVTSVWFPHTSRCNRCFPHLKLCRCLFSADVLLQPTMVVVTVGLRTGPLGLGFVWLRPP